MTTSEQIRLAVLETTLCGQTPQNYLRYIDSLGLEATTGAVLEEVFVLQAEINRLSMYLSALDLLD